jgi:bifunctional ADP-heptose synthase (sugar kinase/adenylyltransferase)
MALLERGGLVEFLPPHGTRAAVDVTGAGDTVMAAFGLALAAGASPRQAAALANVAGSLVVLKPGTATVSLAELQSELGAG